MCVFIKDTTYALDEIDGQKNSKRLLTDREKKELYMPKEFKSNQYNKSQYQKWNIVDIVYNIDWTIKLIYSIE